MRGYGRGDGGGRAGRCEGRGSRELTQTYLQFLGISEGSRGVEAAVELVVEVVAEFLSGGDLAVPGGVIARPGGVCAHERTRPHAGLTQPDSHSNSQTLKLAAFMHR